MNFRNTYGLELMKQVFALLDPILEKLIPEFRQELHKAQQERLKVDNNPKAYWKDQRNRELYLTRKFDPSREHFLYEKDDRFNDEVAFHMYQKREWFNKDFDEKEYQEWLKNPRIFTFKNPSQNTEETTNKWEEFMSKFGSKASSPGSDFKFGSEPKEKPKQTRVQSPEEINLRKALKVLLPDLKPEDDVAQAFRKCSMRYHPDKINVLIRNGQLTENVGKEKKVEYQDVVAAWNIYNESKQ